MTILLFCSRRDWQVPNNLDTLELIIKIPAIFFSEWWLEIKWSTLLSYFKTYLACLLCNVIVFFLIQRDIMIHKPWLKGDITDSGLYAIPLSDIDQIAYRPDKRKRRGICGDE